MNIVNNFVIGFQFLENHITATSAATGEQFIPEHFADCEDRSLRSNNISKQNLSAKCEHNLREIIG